MSKTSTLQKTNRRLHQFAGVAVISLSFTVLQPAYASDVPATGMRPHPKGSDVCPSDNEPPVRRDTIHSIQVNKSLVSKKNKIRLFPDARQQVLFFSVNGEDKRVYQLYLFDMDGRLVNQASIRNKETTVLTSLSEGNYLFEIFTDDERIENGHLVIR
ncbi:MAG TPA: T9SS type A sorting domain-containing protein [Puia sp.]|nr:T9SS type A sorting domain-containing protein [Puia sp.]